MHLPNPSRQIAHGTVCVTPTRTPLRWRWPLFGTCAVLLLIAGAGWIDQRDQVRHEAQRLRHEAAQLRAYAQGREQGHADMVASAEAAWQAAQAEADRCLRAKP